MLSDYLWPQLSHTDVSGLYFQQDGATCHTTRENVTFLRSKFPQRVISRNADCNWPPWSCELTPVDFFLGFFFLSRAYANKPQTINDLKNKIQVAISEWLQRQVEKSLKISILELMPADAVGVDI